LKKIVLFGIMFFLFLIRFSFAQPTYSLNSANNTIAGQPTLFSLNWTSASGYIFSFSNGTGTMINDTFRNFGEINENSADTSPMNALWHMNGDVSDASGNNNNGQMRGTLNCSMPGKFGTACFFDNSSGNYISIGNSTSINFNTSANFTWNLWINRITATDWDVLMGNLNYGTSGLRFVVETDGTVTLLDSDNNGPGTTLKIGANQWYMITVVYTPIHQDIYINGTNMSTSGTGTFVSNSDTNLTIGFSNTDKEQFSGYINDVGIWNRTLSSTEILKLYNNGYNTWSNVTKVINSIVGANISWMIYANDSNNSSNTSSLFSFLTTEPSFPQWRNLGQNSSTVSPNGTVILSAQVYDTSPIDWAVLSTNESGSWQNQSWYSPLNLNNYTKWSSSNDTLDPSVVVDDIDGDGTPEIITCGYYYNITEDKTYAQLRIWNYTATNSTSGSLNLESELDWTNDTTFCYSVKVDDLNHDGHKKIITGGATGVNWNSADLRIFNYTNGQINLEAIKDWYNVSASNYTVIFTLAIADLNGDGKDEIITGGMYNETNYISQLRIWNYTNSVINFVAEKDWYVVGRTEIQSVRVAKLNNDGQPKIITGGLSVGGPRYQAELDIWNFTGGTINLENRTEWYLNNDTIIYSLGIGDLNGDGVPDLVTGGLANDGTRRRAQLRIWNYTQPTLNLEDDYTWYVGANAAEVYSVLVQDINKDGIPEIVTVGMQNNVSDYGQVRIWTWMNKTLSLQRSNEWLDTVDTGGVLEGELDDSLYVADLDGDGINEIIAGGRLESAPNYGILRVYSVGNIYGSPMNLTKIANTWLWSNFTWRNSSVANNSVVGWRIYYNDTYGNVNATDKMTFTVGGPVVSDNSTPTYTNNNSSLVATYTPTAYSNFSITWNDNSGNVNAYLENNFTTALSNDSMNGPYPNYYYNSIPLAAGTYQFRFVGADAYGNSNATDVQYFTIAKANVTTLQLKNNLTVSWTGTYPVSSNTTGSGCPSQLNCELYRNGTGLVSNPDLVLLGVGVYNYTFNTSGNDNYTGNSTSIILTIRQANITVNLYLNGLLNQNKPYTYPQAVNATATSSALTPSLYRNNSYIGTSEQILLGSGTYAYKVNATGNQNYSDNSTGITFYANVGQGTPDVKTFIDGLPTNKSVQYPTIVTIKGNSTTTTTPPTFVLYSNSISLGGGNPVSVTQLSPLDIGTYNIIYNTSGNGNWTSASNSTIFLIVSQNSSNPVKLTINNGTALDDQNVSITYGTPITANCSNVYSGSGSCSLYRDGASVGTNNETVTLGVGTYAYMVNTSGNANYSSNTSGETFYVIVSKATPYTNIQVNETTVEKGDTVNISSWPSASGLSTTIYADFSGTLVNITSNITGTNTNLTDTSNLALGVYQVSANTTGNENYTDNTTLETKYITVKDTTAPKYSDNSTNSTQAGVPTEFRLKWTDNDQLSGYIFSLDNCTNSFYNFSWTPMTGQTNWSNFTTPINETIGCLIKWCFYFNDSAGNENSTSCSSPFSLTTTDDIPPNITNVQAESITTSSATITWTTDEDSNSSLVISPTSAYSNSASLTTSHSIGLSGLSASTTYIYNVISCDASGNCANSAIYQFNSASSGGVGGGSGGSGYISPTCKENWTCVEWSNCIASKQTRVCSDKNKCGTTKSKPAESQSCGETVTCTENWPCTDWSTCINGNQTRTCKDTNNCGTIINKPTESQNCAAEAGQTAAAIAQAPTGLFLSLTTNEWIIAIVIGVVIALVIILFSLKRKKKRKRKVKVKN